ncbi:MAG TPA: peptidylprolyl isomerase [Thermoanaerobaculia bacterium]|nr:peptidylprolyl isomerase [Thermoanaerobaculia bacterium]
MFLPAARRAASSLAGFLALVFFVGCATAPPARGPEPGAAAARRPEAAAAELELRALLLLLADRRMYEQVTVLRALEGGPELREELAVTLGRIGDRKGRRVLQGLLIDDAPAVRRAAAFSLGLLGDPEARSALLAAVHDADHETGVLAVEALGRLHVPVAEVGEQLLALPEDERWARLLPYLFRFREPAMIPLAERGLVVSGADLHARAAYALARDPLPAAAPLLRRLLSDPASQVRAWAARGLGLVGSGADDLAALLPLLDEPPGGRTAPGPAGRHAGDWSQGGQEGPAGSAGGPVIEALRAARALVLAGKAAPAAQWRPRLLQALGDPLAGVRAAAVEAAGLWLPDRELGEALAARAAGSLGAAFPVPVRERGLAVVALAAGAHPRARELAAAAAGAAEADLRAHSAEAAGLLSDAELLSRLASDPSPVVREAALTARLAFALPPPAAAARQGQRAEPERHPTGRAAAAGTEPAAAIAALALADADEGVRAVVLDWLAEHPLLPLKALGDAVAAALRDSSVEAGLAAIKALAARGGAQPLERGAAVAVLENLAGDLPYVLRREAGRGLARLGRPVPALGPADNGKTPETYRDIVTRTRRPRLVEIRTARGALRVRLACSQAPLTCLNFLALAGQGFFTGSSFHRVVPDFVIQGGDPRGDGYGGPGYTIRDEINRLRYARGVVGMALAGPDTGGSQFFITLSPQPHLDGGFTAFGEVVAGGEALDSIVAGERIESVVELKE